MLDQLVTKPWPLLILQFPTTLTSVLFLKPETCLPNYISPALLNELFPDGFKLIREPRFARIGGELAITFTENISVTKQTLEESKFVNFECLNCTIPSNDKSVFLGIIYKQPHSKTNGFSKSSFFREWKEYLNKLVLLKQEILLTGDINFVRNVHHLLRLNNFFHY